MLSRPVYALEITQRPLNNIDNTGPTEEYPRENDMNTNRQSQLSAIFRPILIAMKLTGQFFGETALAEIGRLRKCYISRIFSTLVVLGQWLRGNECYKSFSHRFLNHAEVFLPVGYNNLACSMCK